MWGAYRWAARFLMMVMLVPALAPMAMSCVAVPEAARGMAQPKSAQPRSAQPMTAQSVQPAMHCHHMMAESERTESSQGEVSESSAIVRGFRASDDDCCKNHCCCGATTSEWAQPASNLLSFFSLLIEPAQPLQGSAPQSNDFSGNDSARAPPRS